MHNKVVENTACEKAVCISPFNYPQTLQSALFRDGFSVSVCLDVLATLQGSVNMLGCTGTF